MAVFGTKPFLFCFWRAWHLYVHRVWQYAITCRQEEAGSVTSDTLSFLPDEMSAVAACFNEIRLYIRAHTHTFNVFLRMCMNI